MQTNITGLRNEFEEAPEGALLNTKVVAAFIGKSVSWFNLKAVCGGGVPYTKLGNHRLYKKTDVLTWVNDNGQKVKSTSEYREVA